MANLILFEDDRVEKLAPLAVMRPMYTVRCGGWSLLEMLRTLGGATHGAVRKHLRAFREDDGVGLREDEPTLLVNARLLPDARLLPELRRFLAQAGSASCFVDGALAVAAVAAGKLAAEKVVDPGYCCQVAAELPEQSVDAPLHLHRYPHEVVAGHAATMRRNMEALLESKPHREILPGCYVDGDLQLPPQLVVDAEGGPILVSSSAKLGPFSVLRGPARIGPHTTVNPQSFLKGNVDVGPWCKIGGEVSQSIVEGYSNKAHFGYLGTSYVGRWVNLGAGTTNSNLKNTYGTVRVAYPGEKMDTGMQFLGCLVGDFTKTAIHTSIYTGKLLGVCSNVYGTVTRNVPSFCNYAQSLGDVTEHGPAVVEVSQRRMYARRGREQTAADVQLIRDAYALEAPKRHLADKPPSL